MYNRNVGYGSALLSGIPFAGSGKARVVGNSSVANRSMLREIFGVDPEGSVRFFETMQEANDACSANAFDVVYVLPGHTETVTGAAALALDTAGVVWIGLGHGSNRPTINFTTAVGASMVFGGANARFHNFLLTGGIDALTGPVSIDAADVLLLDIETRDVTGQATDFIVTTANANRLKINGWRHRGATAAGADTAISIVGGTDIEIDNFDIDGNFAVANIETVTTAPTNLRIGTKSVTNLLRTRNAADILLTTVTATSGVVDNILGSLQDNAANITEAFALSSMRAGNNLYVVNLDGERAMQWNGTASTDA